MKKLTWYVDNAGGVQAFFEFKKEERFYTYDDDNGFAEDVKLFITANEDDFYDWGASHTINDNLVTLEMFNALYDGVELFNYEKGELLFG